MSERLSDQLRERAAKALISYAIFRWESAAMLALTLILAVLVPIKVPFLPWWLWLILGTLGEVGVIVTSLYDPAVRERVVAEMFREKFNPREIRNKEYRTRIEKALEYRKQMEVLLQHTRDGALKVHLQATIDDVADWIGNMFRLARKLDLYGLDSVLKRDLQTVPREIQALEQRLQNETDIKVREQLKQSLANKRAQWQHLDMLDNTIERAVLQLDDTLSAMGTVYAQMQLISAKDIDSGRAQRLRADVAAQINSLHDIVETMDQVYAQSALTQTWTEEREG